MRRNLRTYLKAFGQIYPLYSGCGTLANSSVFRRALENERARVMVSLDVGAKIIVPTNDFIGRAIYYFADLDPKITWVCRKLLRPGDTVIDIGANLGLVALTAAALVGERGLVHAFEPQPEFVNLLRRSARVNAFRHLRIHGVALGMEDGELELFVPRWNAGRASLVRREASGGRGMVVPVRDAGTYLNALGFGPIRLLKIDVEGYEPYVINAAANFLSAHPPDCILFELNDYTGRFSEQEVVKQLVALDYEFLEIRRSLIRMRLFRIDMKRPRDGYGNDVLAVRRGPGSSEIVASVAAA
jgi:FkbM family methyltransferase